jgi:hypothetical protein
VFYRATTTKENAMAQLPSLFSINGLAVELGKDRRAIARILRTVEPDGIAKGQPRWRIETVLAAMAYQQRDGGNPQLQRAVDQIEELACKLDAGFERLRKIKSVDKRRKAAAQIGPLVGQLDGLMAKTNLSLPNGEKDLAEMARAHIIGHALKRLLALCEWTVAAKAA